jgi:hypothetical protein
LWKYSFELINRELELAKKKNQALDDLFTSNKVSKSTFEYLETEIKATISDLEKHLERLSEKMKERAQELEKQIHMLEIFLANLEIHHIAGEIDNEAYEKQNRAITLGLETTKQELQDLKNSLTVSPNETVEETKISTITSNEEKPKIIENGNPNFTSSTEQTALNEENKLQY